MTKYNVELDMETKNSLSLIINKINDGTRVLEFGPAHGRMTKYLSETKKCKVDIVEIDEESGREAENYANKALIGEREGDIGNFLWLEILKNERYDYIIFADVLEHLYDPWKVLSDCRRLLKDDGSILISIPNVAHNSVLINLLTDEFNYNPIGLLDNTHIRFFTYHSLKDMIAKAGLVTVSEQATYGRVGQIEIPGNYDKINNLPVEKYLKNRERGNVYQFVFEAKKKEYYEEQDVLISKNIDGRLSDEIVFYIKEEEDSQYTENKSIRKKIYGESVDLKIELDTYKNIKEIRIDPIDVKGIILLARLEVFNDKGIEIPEIRETNANMVAGNSYLFLHDDPQFIISLKQSQYKALNISYEMITYDTQTLNVVYNMMTYLQNEEEEKRNLLGSEIQKLNEKIKAEELRINTEQALRIEEQSQKIEEQSAKIEEQSAKIEEMELENNELTEQQDLLIETERELDAHKKYLNSTLLHVTKLEEIIRGYNKTQENKWASKLKGKLNKINILAKKSYQTIKNEGLKAFFYKAKKAIKKSKEYIDDHEFTEGERDNILKKIDTWENKPLISVIMPVYNVEPIWLNKAIQSVENQLYDCWELCIVDDCSTNRKTIDALKKIHNPKIKIKFSETNGGISVASNTAFSMSNGEIICLMDNDDVISPKALYEIAKIFRDKNCDVAYTDEDKIDIEDRHSKPFCKPDWSPDLLLSQMYICHLLAIKRELFEKMGGFREEFDGSQDYDLMLRISEITDNICHIPKILYSWREISTSTSMNPDSKPTAHIAGLRAIQSHLDRQYSDQNYKVCETKKTFVYDVRYSLKNEPLVSIIIPFKDKVELTQQCIDSILKKTSYKNYEIILLNNRSEEVETTKWINKIRSNKNIKVINADCEFNWSKINNIGIREAKGEVYVFLNNDILIISEDWLERIAENSLREDIGVVGGLLLYEDNTIQHAGVVIGLNGWADHIFKGMEAIHFGSPYVSPLVTRNVTAVTGACMGISKRVIEKIGLFDENFIICGSDVEMCIRALKYGLRNIYVPYIKLYHLESKSRDSYIPEVDFEMSKLHYKPYLEHGDPYFNENLDPYSIQPKFKQG